MTVPFSTFMMALSPVNSLLTPSGKEFVRLVPDKAYFKPEMVTFTLMSPAENTEQRFPFLFAG